MPRYDQNGAPIFDTFGDAVPSVPLDFIPSVRSSSGNFHFVWMEVSELNQPPEIDPSGFPLIGEYHRLGVATNSGIWSVEAASDLAEGINQPHFADRLDDTLSLAYWRENLLYIDTIT